MSMTVMPRGGVVVLLPNALTGGWSALPPQSKQTRIPNQKGAMRLVRLTGGLTKSKGVCVYGLGRSPASASIFSTLVLHPNNDGVSTSRGLCLKKKNVLMEQKMKARQERSKVESARCCTHRPIAWIKNHIIWTSVRLRAKVSALFLSQMAFAFISGYSM